MDISRYHNPAFLSSISERERQLKVWRAGWADVHRPSYQHASNDGVVYLKYSCQRRGWLLVHFEEMRWTLDGALGQALWLDGTGEIAEGPRGIFLETGAVHWGHLNPSQPQGGCRSRCLTFIQPPWMLLLQNVLSDQS